MTQKKETFNAALAGFGITLVVLGHSSILPSENGDALRVDYAYSMFLAFIAWIYTFHMPLFIFLSGYNYAQFTLPKKEGYPKLIKDKALRLLVPYAVISTVAYPIKVLLNGFALRPVDVSLLGYVRQLIDPWENVIIFFWFLPTLFLLFCMAPAFSFFQSRICQCAIFVILVGSYLAFPHQPPNSSIFAVGNIGGAFHNAVFFFLGMSFFRLFYSDDQRFLAAIVLICVSTLGFASMPLLSSLNTLLISLFWIAVSLVVVRYVFAVRSSFAWIGSYAFQIYLFSWFLQIPVKILLGKILHLDIWLVVLSSVFCGLGIPIIVTKYLDEVFPRRFRYLYGR